MYNVQKYDFTVSTLSTRYRIHRNNMNKKPFIDSRTTPRITSSYSFHESEISPVFTKIKTKDGASYNLVKERSKRSNKFTFYILRKAPSVSIKEIDSMFLLQTSRKIDWKNEMKE